MWSINIILSWSLLWSSKFWKVAGYFHRTSFSWWYQNNRAPSSFHKHLSPESDIASLEKQMALNIFSSTKMISELKLQTLKFLNGLKKHRFLCSLCVSKFYHELFSPKKMLSPLQHKHLLWSQKKYSSIHGHWDTH